MLGVPGNMAFGNQNRQQAARQFIRLVPKYHRRPVIGIDNALILVNDQHGIAGAFHDLPDQTGIC